MCVHHGCLHLGELESSNLRCLDLYTEVFGRYRRPVLVRLGVFVW